MSAVLEATVGRWPIAFTRHAVARFAERRDVHPEHAERALRTLCAARSAYVTMTPPGWISRGARCAGIFLMLDDSRVCVLLRLDKTVNELRLAAVTVLALPKVGAGA
jgi:hypothetical protein